MPTKNDAINKASAREKSIRHGHPSTLHLWRARPLLLCLLRCHPIRSPVFSVAYMPGARKSPKSAVEDLMRGVGLGNRGG